MWERKKEGSRNEGLSGARSFTPLKTKMEPKNEGLEDYFPFQTGDFEVPC